MDERGTLEADGGQGRAKEAYLGHQRRNVGRAAALLDRLELRLGHVSARRHRAESVSQVGMVGRRSRTCVGKEREAGELPVPIRLPHVATPAHAAPTEKCRPRR
jgi:hypothetical protein